MRPRGIWLIPFCALVFLLSRSPLHAEEAPSNNSPQITATINTPVPEEADADNGEDLSDEIGFDIPITINKRVEHFLKVFQNEKKRPFSNWLSRSTRYIPQMHEILRENGLPEDLVYIAMVESGFNVSAYSHAHACGIWQFIEETAERYGLKVSRWLDERRNPEKATVAAAKYLKRLYQEFGCWYLAAAGYNAGENRVRRGLRTYENADFWDMCDRDLFSRETKDYVPQIIAAAIIAKSPEKYGFTDVEYLKPIACAKVSVPPQTDLKAVALASGVDYRTLGMLNAELRRGCTPPGSSFKVSIPQGSLQAFNSNFSRVKKTRETRYHQYIANKGDTLKGIAARFGITKKVLLSSNRTKAKIKKGQILRIPYAVENYVLGPKKSNVKLASFIPQEEDTSASRSSNITYNVKKGDTLYRIAKHFGLSVESLRKQNKLSEKAKIATGQSLVIKSEAKAEVAEKPSIETRQAKYEAREYRYHKVRKGETIWKIAKKYKVVPADIRSWNNMRDDAISPGLKLKLEVSSNS